MINVSPAALDNSVKIFTVTHGTFSAVTTEEFQFDFSPNYGDKVCRKYRKSGNCNDTQYRTNRDGNVENEIAYAQFLAKRDGIDLTDYTGSVQYIDVKLSGYKQLVKRAHSVTFRTAKGSRSNPSKSIVIKIPHVDYDATLPAIDISSDVEIEMVAEAAPVITETVCETVVVEVAPRRRGRPPGARNKIQRAEVHTVRRPRGRPFGSRNKNTVEKIASNVTKIQDGEVTYHVYG